MAKRTKRAKQPSKSVGKLVTAVIGTPGRPTIAFTVNGINIMALVDTGACCNLLRRDILEQIMHRTHRSCLLKPAPALQAANGAPLDTAGKTEIKIDNVKKPVEVVIANTLPFDMILGDVSLRSGNSIIDLTKNNMMWFNRRWTLNKQRRYGIDGIGETPPQTGSPRFDALIKKNSDIFSAKGEANGDCRATALTIETDGPPICQKAYRTPLPKRRLIEEAVAEMLVDGVIRPSHSTWASPVILVPKKDGSTRFCVDYRRLNAVTRKDKYPLPVIQDIFDQVGGSTVYSTLDLKAGYWQLPVAERDIDKTAFRCHLGLFEFMKIPFGLANAPSVFQRTMDNILSGLIGTIAYVYLDDIVIYSQNMEDHERDLQAVFDRLRTAGLRLKPTKCVFGLNKVKLLGYVLSNDGIQTDPEKVTAITKLQAPKSLNEVRSFLGMTGYYRQCMPNYAKVAEPLVCLTRKNVRFEWNEEREQAFEKLKLLLTSSHVMTAPDVRKPYKLYTDAWDYAVGAILIQTDEEGTEKVIQYVSHALSTTQRRWATIEKEAYAVVYAIHKLRPYLQGAEFVVYTDHKPLKSLFTRELNNTKIQIWGVLLAEYGATIEYRTGKNNIRADMLSRIRHPQVEGVAIIDVDDWIDPLAIPEEDMAESLPLLHDGLDLAAIAAAQREELPDLYRQGEDEEDDDYQVIKGVLYSTVPPMLIAPQYPRLVLPPTFRDTVIDKAHKEVGHMAAWKTRHRLMEAYVWKGIYRDVRDRLRKCPVCLVHGKRVDHVPMGEMPVADYPMQIIGMDLIGPFVASPSGNRYVFTLIDHCTGWAEAFPLKDKTNKSVSDAFANLFLPRHGVPETVISDNGGEFTASEWEQYLKNLGIKHNRTTPVHPQSNGRTERFNRTLKTMLEKLVNNDAASWEDRLGEALLAYRTSVSTVTGHTPFFLTYGRHSRLPLTRAQRSHGNNTFGNRLDDLANALKIARHLTEDSRKYNRERLARKANANDIAVGDSVVIKAEERMTLTSRWDPHWEVTRVRGPVLRIRQQQTGRIRMVNREKVKLVDPTVSWDECRPRPLRVQHKPKLRARDVDTSDVRRGDVQVQANPPATVAMDPSDSDHQPTKKRRHAETQPQTQTDQNQNRRSQRQCRLSERARALCNDNVPSDSDSDNDMEVEYFRKRQGSLVSEADNKRARMEVIALVSVMCR